MIKNAKRDYYKDLIAQNKGDARMLWKTLNENRKTGSLFSTLNSAPGSLIQPLQIAGKFDSFFLYCCHYPI